MTYEEFKEEIKRISDTYDFDLEVMEKGNSIVVGNENLSYALIHKNVPYNMNTILSGLNLQGDSLKYELFVICCELAQTPIKERQEERYIIPLPHLVTTDGEQQYLTHNGSFFASRRDKKLRQTWKEEHLKYVPEEYRKYAVEVEE